MEEREGQRVIERGSVAFYYRPKLNAGRSRKARHRKGAQRFYIVTQDAERDWYRIIVLGKKQLPQKRIRLGGSPKAWGFVELATDEPQAIRRALLPERYETKTRGEREIGSATRLAEGTYEIVSRDRRTELAYILDSPTHAGERQRRFGIASKASYVISVRNPATPSPSFMGVIAQKRTADYPQELLEMFGDRKWIDVTVPGLLDYKDAQVLLIGAKSGKEVEELGVSALSQSPIRRDDVIPSWHRPLKPRRKE